MKPRKKPQRLSTTSATRQTECRHKTKNSLLFSNSSGYKIEKTTGSRSSGFFIGVNFMPLCLLNVCKRPKCFFKLIASIFFSAFCYPAFSESDGNLLKEGITLFKKQEYQGALLLFESAINQGEASPILHYNLAVTYFKLQQYERAIKYFRRLEGSKLEDLGALNLGYCWLAVNEQSLAQEMFERASLSKHKKIRLIAQKELQALSANRQSIAALERSRPDSKLSISGLLYSLYGQDDYVRFVDDELTTAKTAKSQSNYLQLFSMVKLHLPYGVELYGNHLSIEYEENEGFDFALNKLGVETEYELGEWLLTPSVEWFESGLGEFSYQSGVNIELELELKADGADLDLSVYYSDISPQDPQFDNTEGTKTRVRADYTKYFKYGDLRTSLQLEFNNRQDSELKSYSPNRNSFGLEYSLPLGNKLDFFSEINFRKTRYSEIAGFAREENRIEKSLGARWRILRNLSINFSYELEDVSSNIPYADYDRSVISAGFTAFFSR